MAPQKKLVVIQFSRFLRANSSILLRSLLIFFFVPSIVLLDLFSRRVMRSLRSQLALKKSAYLVSDHQWLVVCPSFTCYPDSRAFSLRSFTDIPRSFIWTMLRKCYCICRNFAPKHLLFLVFSFSAIYLLLLLYTGNGWVLLKNSFFFKILPNLTRAYGSTKRP